MSHNSRWESAEKCISAKGENIREQEKRKWTISVTNEFKMAKTIDRDDMIRKIKEEEGIEAAWKWCKEHPRD